MLLEVVDWEFYILLFVFIVFGLLVSVGGFFLVHYQIKKSEKRIQEIREKNKKKAEKIQ